MNGRELSPPDQTVLLESKPNLTPGAIFPPTLALPLERLCRNDDLSLRAPEGSVAISLISNLYEIGSVVPLTRNDIVTQSPRGKGGGGFIQRLLWKQSILFA